MEHKIEELTDAEAEAFTRYLTELPVKQKKSLAETLSETIIGRKLLIEWLEQKLKGNK